MSTDNIYDKKIFTAQILAKDIWFLTINSPKISGVFRDKNISRTFIEKIMMVTTAVNGCIYCEWFHAKQAVESGISKAEVRNLLKLQFQADATEFETVALLYAQHFAETNRNPDPAMTKKLFDYYGEKTANHIILVIRMIYFGNLYGNTWDVVISRFRGVSVPNSNIIFEFFYFLINAPLMFPAMILMKLEKKK